MDKIWLKLYPPDVPEEIDPEEYSNIHEILEAKAQKFKNKKAVTCMGSSLSFKKLDLLSKHFAAYLQKELGLRKGERLAIMMPNTPQYLIALFGALKAGLVVVNVNPLYTPKELVYQLLDSRTQSILVMENYAHTISDALPHINLKNVIISRLGDFMPFPKRNAVNFSLKYVKKSIPKYKIPDAKYFHQAIQKGLLLTLDHVDVEGNDSAFLQYTGGTTGIPKGAILTHRNIVANVLQLSYFIRHIFTEGKAVSILPLPLYHIYALTASLCKIHMGAETVLIVNPRDIPEFVNELKSYNWNWFCGLNTLFQALLNDEEFRRLDFPNKFYTSAGGMATKKSIAREWQRVTGSVVLEGYGLTETSPFVTLNPLESDTFTGTVGIPLSSIEVDIKAEDGRSLSIGEEGEICIKGPNVMQGYWNKPEETIRVFTEDGWLRTGDIGVMNRNGNIRVINRKKDVIIVGGFNVYPKEVEEVILYHPGVLEVAVVAENEEHSGELVKAFIVKDDPGITPEEIKSHCSKFLTPYKIPSIIVFRKELPKSLIGKMLRRKLRMLRLDTCSETTGPDNP